MLAPLEATAHLEDRLDRPRIDVDHVRLDLGRELAEDLVDALRVAREHQDVDHRPTAHRQHPHHVEAPEVRPHHDRAALLLGEPVERLEALDLELEVVRLSKPDREPIDDREREGPVVEEAVPGARSVTEGCASSRRGMHTPQVGPGGPTACAIGQEEVGDDRGDEHQGRPAPADTKQPGRELEPPQGAPLGDAGPAVRGGGGVGSDASGAHRSASRGHRGISSVECIADPSSGAMIEASRPEVTPRRRPPGRAGAQRRNGFPLGSSPATAAAAARAESSPGPRSARLVER